MIKKYEIRFTSTTVDKGFLKITSDFAGKSFDLEENTMGKGISLKIDVDLKAGSIIHIYPAVEKCPCCKRPY